MPRATVLHEKKNADGHIRHHCHVVWSRIDTTEMNQLDSVSISSIKTVVVIV